MADVSISIVLPVFNRSALSRQCLDILVADHDLADVEIVVVDDGSTDETAELLSGYGERIVVVSHEQNRGFAHSCNDGAERARGNVLVFLNNDTVPLSGWLSALRAYALAHPRVGVLGARLLYPDGTVQHAGVAFGLGGYPYHIYNGFPAHHPAVLRSRPLQAVTGACLWVERPLFAALQGFDPLFVNGFEDIDFCLRARAAGHEVHYCGETSLIHLESQTRGYSQSEGDANLGLFLSRWSNIVERDDVSRCIDDGVITVNVAHPFRIHLDPAVFLSSDLQLANTPTELSEPRQSSEGIRAAKVWKIGIVGTFDVENYGDLLFPLIAQAELAKRLGDVVLTAYSYHPKSEETWPYQVRPITDLFADVGGLDGLLIGGGHIIRFDSDIAPAYLPEDPDLAHPTGMWLTPALLALQAGTPVMWNAPGVHGITPTAFSDALAFSLRQSPYVSVRDELSSHMLHLIEPGAVIDVVPDTAFGVDTLVDREQPSAEFLRLRWSLGLDASYVVVQGHRFVQAMGEQLAKDPAFDGHLIVVIPVGPVLGDSASWIGVHGPRVVHCDEFVSPTVIAELIAHSCGVVAQSMHAAITAMAFGVPVVRPTDYWNAKYAVLARFPQVLQYSNADLPTASSVLAHLLHDFSDAQVLVRETQTRLTNHWDHIARVVGTYDDAARRATVSESNRRLSQSLVERGQSTPDTSEHPATAEYAGIAHQQGEWLQTRIAELEGEASAIRAETVASRRMLETRIAELEGEASAVRAETAASQRTLDLANQALQASQHRYAAAEALLRSIGTSTSWKVTAPVRSALQTVRRRPRRALWEYDRVLELDQVRRAQMSLEPYPWTVIGGLFSPRNCQKLVSTFPDDGFKTMRAGDGEKDWHYEVRSIVPMGYGERVEKQHLTPIWYRLATDLTSVEYRLALTAATGIDLSDALIEVNAFHYGPESWLGSHVDLPTKRVVHVLYFNQGWNLDDGGALRILRSQAFDDRHASIVPEVGTSALFIRSANSWHAVEPVLASCTESRRSVVVTFYEPDAPSTMWPAGDEPDLHPYGPTQRRLRR